jgi:hypothetical protein
MFGVELLMFAAIAHGAKLTLNDVVSLSLHKEQVKFSMI